ncbi:MAG: energy-coupling factor ABC transporter ATP-binding protein [Thermodesulfovibrionales bacterium]|nr:energy-coupling factor ABC transporter ATP-binding protein [Thermodesulfovibrionales bacterium]
MDNNTILLIKNLSFSYPGGRKIFKELNFSLKRGDKIGLVGANGSGKTTLFYLIMGLLKTDRGEIYIFNKRRVQERDFFEVRQKIGLMFQDSDDQLFCPTVEEDIAFGPLNLGKSRQEVDQIVEETCQSLGISNLRKRITYKLSGGEKRLISFATLVAMRPQCLLLDEPTAGLDEETTYRLLEYLRNRFDTYIIVSHDQAFLNQTIKETYYLKDGNIFKI